MPAAQGKERTTEGQSSKEAELSLEGVVVSSHPSFSIALVRRQGARRARPIRVGEKAYGWTLVEVLEEMALFERDGEEVCLLLGAESKPPAAPAAGLPGTEEKIASSGAESLLAINDGDIDNDEWVKRRFERSEMRERLTKEMPMILAKTGLTVKVEEGQVRGLQITHLPDGTLLSEAGLLAGDILRSINDVPLDGLETLAGLYPRLESESEIRIVVERRGRVLRLGYEIR